MVPCAVMPRSTGPRVILARLSQRPIAQAGQVLDTAGDQLLDLNGSQGCCRARRPAVVARDADQRFPDGHLLGRPDETAPAMMIDDRGDPAAQRAAADCSGQPGEVGGDQHGMDQQDSRIDLLRTTPSGEFRPVSQIRGPGRRGDGIARVVGGGRDGIGQRAVQHGGQGHGQLPGAHQAPHDGQGIVRPRVFRGRRCRVPWMMRLGCLPNQSVGLSQVHETVSWMMRICLQDRATTRARMGASRAGNGSATGKIPLSAISRHYHV